MGLLELAQVCPLSLGSDILQKTGIELGRRQGGFAIPACGEGTRRRNAVRCVGVQRLCSLEIGCAFPAEFVAGQNAVAHYLINTGGCQGLFCRWSLFSLSAQIFHKYFLGTYCVPDTVLGRWAPAGHSRKKARGVCLL